MITGASGFLGNELIPELKSFGHEILLVGRNLKILSERYPGYEICGYNQITDAAFGFDLMIHLAVLNNNFVGESDKFHDINVKFLIETATLAQKARVKKLINISTFHVFNLGTLSEYAKSKLAGEKLLSKIDGLNIETIYLPMVYGKLWGGKLKLLNYLPKFLASFFFQFIASLKPTVEIGKIVTFINHQSLENSSENRFIFKNQDKNLVFVFSKRLIDLLFAMTIIMSLFWLILLLCVAIRMESRGSPIFCQSRVGKNGKVFTCYKFRTMKLGTEEISTHQVSPSSITWLGNFLRKTKIDELPQVVNILRNEISLVGPRPSLTSQEILLNERKKRGVLNVKPGITGWAQIQNIDMSNPVKLARTDAQYLAFQSTLLDLKIIIKTAFGSGQGDKIH